MRLALALLLLATPAHGAWVGAYVDTNGDVAGHIEARGEALGLSLYGFADVGESGAFARTNATLPLYGGLGAFVQADFSNASVALGGVAYDVSGWAGWASLRLMASHEGDGRAMLSFDLPITDGLHLDGFADWDTRGRFYFEPQLAWRVRAPLWLLVEYRHGDGTDSAAFGVRVDL